MHNLKVAGSNPAPETAQTPENIDVFGVFDSHSGMPKWTVNAESARVCRP